MTAWWPILTGFAAVLVAAVGGVWHLRSYVDRQVRDHQRADNTAFSSLRERELLVAEALARIEEGLKGLTSRFDDLSQRLDLHPRR